MLDQEKNILQAKMPFYIVHVPKFSVKVNAQIPLYIDHYFKMKIYQNSNTLLAVHITRLPTK